MTLNVTTPSTMAISLAKFRTAPLSITIKNETSSKLTLDDYA